MSKQDDYEQNARATLSRRSSVRAGTALLALAERWLRPADQLDYMIRRWLIPVPFEANRSVASTLHLRRSLLLKRSQSVAQSMPQASMRSNGPLSEVQAAIGQRLRAEYAPERSIPARLANLLKQFEQRNDTLEAMTRRPC